ncbi:MAG: hypothetical protein AAFY71_25760 [Bacteroidota bacterium]
MKRIAFFCLLVLLSSAILAQSPLFESDEILEFTLTANFDKFVADRSLKAEYYPAHITISNQGKDETVKLKIKVRGRFRREENTCDFPPIRLNFKKGELPHPFEGQNKLKLVTHCKDEETILKEYYVYKTFNLFTEKSFLTRLAKITYVDKNGNRPTETRYAFIIESEDDMAKRNKATSLPEDITIRKEEVNQRMLARVHLFNYMIANFDFNVTVRQNMKVITNGKGKPIAIPYDFDWAGIVAAPYTLEKGDKKHPYFARRKFKKLCLPEDEWTLLINEFNDKREAIFELYETSTLLSEDSKKETIKLYKNFYKHINRKKTIADVLRKRCN